jgi:hypothetical protein
MAGLVAGTKRWKGWRGVALALTVLALAAKVLVPPGFMAAGPGAPFPITICTGHGPLVLSQGDGKASNLPAHKLASPCSGADNITPTAASLAAAATNPFFWTLLSPGAGPTDDVAPGRGLAAPPPPSQAPPPSLS